MTDKGQPADDGLDTILEQLQYGTIMSDNQEPMLTNNRTIAKAALQALLDRRIDYNTMVADNVRAVANSDGPAIWREPVTSKYLYNEHESHRRTAAVLERLLQYHGAYIGMGGKRVDDMVHHSVIQAELDKLNQEGH